MHRVKLGLSAIVILVAAAGIHAQRMDNNKLPAARVAHISKDFPVADLDNTAWETGEEVTVTRYWSGNEAPKGRQFNARLIWSDTALYVRFAANQNEPLIVSDKPNLKSKTRGLWDRDVCEIFIAPDPNEPNRYFEFEVAPTGEWIDVGIHVTPEGRESDWDYNSGMESVSRIENGRVVMAIKVKWEALGKRPKMGDIWLGNLFRCIGKDPDRGYLAWQPTMTPEPSFHVPEKFRAFEFR